MSIRDRLKAKQAAQQPVELEDVDSSQDVLEEAEEVEIKPAVKKNSKSKAPVVEVVEDEPEEEVDDELDITDEDDSPVLEVEKVSAGKSGKASVSTKSTKPQVFTDEEPEEVEIKPAVKKTKAPVVSAEDEVVVKKSTTKTTKEKDTSKANKPGFLKSRSVPEMKTYDDGDWLPRKEFLNRILEKCKDTNYSEITKGQLEELLNIIEAATVETLETNDITLLGQKTKTVITNPRLYAPRESGIPHVKTEYHTQVNSYREVTLKLRFGFESKRGNVDKKGNFVEGKFDNGKFTPGKWTDKETFVPSKK